jgi:hypothetical protein
LLPPPTPLPCSSSRAAKNMRPVSVDASEERCCNETAMKRLPSGASHVD